ncbi:FUSC family protein [Terriglobus roseus]|uniref:Fusaric acid resistance protein-like n=1 Tax=Terriglobus roseus TaxID=392734 RepID=A0A1H4M859_9BACT|nr:FUSC family protein [Terriglobus roseus]SEB78695.1 Fusaric acid resistance protein-like [Terriglobus roseus]
MAENFRSQLVAFDWSKSEPLHAFLCLPGIALPLIVGLHFGYPGTAALMVGGAQCVGFGSYQPPLFHRSGAMLAASIGIAISALVGALCRDSTTALLVTSVVWAVLYGLSNSISTATAWVGQQCCIFLVVSSAAPSTPGTTHDLVYSALLRGAGVLAGALLQYAILLLCRYFVAAAQTRFSSPDFDPTHFQRAFLLEQLKPRSGAFQFALRMGVTAAVSIAIYRAQTWTSAYWIGMTALLIPKPEFSATALRALLRAAGTLAGAALCTVIVVELQPRGMWLALLVLVFQFAAYLLANVNYGAFALALTGYICFVLAVAHQPPREVMLHRVLATLAGTGIALAVHLAFILGRKALNITPPTLHSLEERL